MDGCPSEVIFEISRWACLDGGKTGSVLALVSHFVRHASAPARYQSLALEPWTLQPFVEAIPQLVAAGALIQTRYLYLKFQSSYWDIQTCDYRGVEGERLRNEEIARAKTASGRYECDSKEATHVLLKHVAAHLNVLVIHGNSSVVPILSLPFPLPYLSSLTVPTLEGDSDEHPLLVHNPFPRLHTLSLLQSADLGSSWCRLVLLAPSNSLRRLHVAQYWGKDKANVPQLLRKQLGLQLVNTHGAVPERVYDQLRNLRQISLAVESYTDLTILRRFHSTGVAEGNHYHPSQLWLHLLELEQDCANHHGLCASFKLLPGTGAIGELDPRAKDRWLDDIAGRPGIWAAFE